MSTGVGRGRRGIARPPEHGAAISAALRRRWATGEKRVMSPEGRASFSVAGKRRAARLGADYYARLGRGPRSEETKARMRKPKSAEHRARIRAARLGKPRPDITGPRHPNWRDGASTKAQKERQHAGVREWSKAVLKRDGRCLQCGTTEDLAAHHIRPFALFPELRAEISNGATLCAPCHRLVHRTKDPAYLVTAA